jgi:hypothetical protein
MAHPGVQAVARGWARTDGTWTRERAWLVFVERKRARLRVGAHALLPRWVMGPDGLRTRVDVIEGGLFRSTAGDGTTAGSFVDPVRPLRAGYSLGLRRRTGTLGLVAAPVDGLARPLLLSSSHVLNRRPDGRRYALYQPGGCDRVVADGPVARAWRFTRLHPRVRNRTEGGLARVLPGVPVDTRHPLGEVRGVAADVALGSRLRKVSRSTGFGCGTLVAKAWTGNVRFERRRYPFADQWLVQSDDGAVSLSGDSGAVWLTEDLRVASMNFAGSPCGSISICMPAARLFERLRIRLPTPEEERAWRATNAPD